jgi:ABC-2 type transport system permease protein
MTAVLAVARREWASFFRVPLGWLALATFSFVTSWLFLRGVLVPGQPASMRPIFSTMGWLLLPLAPAVSMRLISEELRSGTIEPLQTSPVSDYAVILGKFLGGLAFLLLLLTPTLIHAVILWSAAVPAPAPSPDIGPMLTGFVSFTLLASLFLAVGLLISTLTSNQTLAFLGTLMAILAVMVGPDLAVQSLASIDAATTRGADFALTLAKALRIGVRLEDFAKGIIDTGHVAAFLAWTIVFLVAAAASLESRRWRSIRSPRRILRFGGFSFALLAATLLSAVLATTLADRFARRFDATRTGEHQLTPRTAELVKDLKTDAEIIIAADWLAMDRRSREDLSDVLARFAAASPRVRSRSIDFASAAGRADYAALLRESLAREAAPFAAAQAVISEAIRVLPQARNEFTTTVLPSIDTNLAAVPDAAGSLATAIARIRQAIEGVTVSLRTVALAEEAAPTLMSRVIEGAPVPAIDEAAAALSSALDITTQRALALEGELRTLASAQPRAAASVRAAADAVRASRERLDTAAEPLRRLPTLDTLVIASAVGQSSALIVRVSDPAAPGRSMVRAVQLDRVMRASTGDTDIRRRAESEIAAALAAATNPTPPIVVFLSADPAIASGVRVYDQATRRILQSGGDVVSWDLILSTEPPSLAKLNPTNARPVLYVVRMPDQTQPAYGQVPSGLDRAARLAEIAAELESRGSPILLCVAPAILPSAKQPEAADRVLASFGLRSRSDRVILTAPSVEATAVEFSQAARAIPREIKHPFVDAIAGATLILPWTTALELADTSSSNPMPAALLFEVGSPKSWRESRWIDLRRSLAEGRWPRLLPQFDAAEDDRAPAFPVIAAAERLVDSKPRRLVAVASAEWLDDSLVTRQRSVDGRAVLTAGGNLELFDAAISWLANQESRSLAGAGTQSVAMVDQLSGSRRAGLGWALLLGLPLAILLLGVLWRLWRG